MTKKKRKEKNKKASKLTVWQHLAICYCYFATVQQEWTNKLKKFLIIALCDCIYVLIMINTHIHKYSHLTIKKKRTIILIKWNNYKFLGISVSQSIYYYSLTIFYWIKYFSHDWSFWIAQLYWRKYNMHELILSIENNGITVCIVNCQFLEVFLTCNNNNLLNSMWKLNKIGYY